MKAFISYALAAFLFPGVAASQKTSLDSLALAVQNLPDDTAKISRLFELSDLLYNSDLNQEGVALKQGYYLAKKLKAGAWIPRFESRLGANFANSGQPDSALHYLGLARTTFEGQGNDKELAGVFTKMRWVYNYLGEYKMGLDYAYRAHAIYEKTGDQVGIALANNYIAEMLYSQENFEEALVYGQKAYDQFKKLGRREDIAFTAQTLGDIWLQLAEYDKALAYQNEALGIRQELNQDIDIAISLNSRGNVYKFMERYPEALADYQLSMKMADAVGFPGLAQACMGNIGQVYSFLGEYRRALPFHLKNRKLVAEMGDLTKAGENMEMLALTYHHLGQNDSAYYFQKLYSDLRDSLLPEETRHSMAELQTMYETAQRDAKIAVQAGQISKERTRFWATAGGLLLALLGGGLLYRLTKQLRQRNQEKEFLIKEIHHRVKNNLQVLSSLLYLQSKHIKDDAALDAVREGQSRVEAMGLIHQKLYMGENLASVEMRDYLHNLGNTLLDAYRLDEDRVKIVYHLEPMHLDVDTAIPLGLIINELVTNSLKYAFPEGRNGVVEVSLWKNADGKLCLKVADNGVGKEGAPELKNSTSFGTSLVQLLSKKLKGTPKVLDGEGYATVVEFERFKEA